ncbi:hypothetical protein [Streptomyces sp. MBT53]|uniref:hypothetical protein n=1 Tax=Streptomyces sp. MBT53 TaxID=1488384 RepID=UPI001911F08E|nr:hypothetical protein [Streptomyces sp. MBT53]MBK6015337.1 hypothetical protein [Streptomyces sp. MBT53]
MSAPAATVVERMPKLRSPVTTQPEHGQELIPQPERTPDAVRVALAHIAPHRLGEMERHKEQALTAAIADGKIGHLQHWLTYWHAQVEIEGRPDLSARYQRALAAVHGTDSKDDPAFRFGMTELTAVETEAEQAVSA